MYLKRDGVREGGQIALTAEVLFIGLTKYQMVLLILSGFGDRIIIYYLNNA